VHYTLFRRAGLPYPQVWPVNRVVPPAFRLRVSFLRPSPLPSGTPVLESPVFDDVSITYVPNALANGLRLLDWREGE
jgi:hypothetical protein